MTEQNTVTLRPYQEEALRAVEQCLQAGTTRVIISTPTGTGKATMTAQLPRRLGTPLLLLTHREELLDQHELQMRRANPVLRIGIEQSDRRASSTDDVILASIPTLTAQHGRRLARFTTVPWKAVVVDEVHHAPAQTWQRAIEALGCLTPQGPPLIGTSATLRRGDGVGLEKLFQKIAYQKSLREMIDEGWCCNLRAFAIHTDVSLDHVRTHHGDFAEGSLAHTVNTPSRNTMIVEAWRRFAESRRTLVFAANVLHAEALAISFRRAGLEAQALTGALDRDTRRARLEAFRKGHIPILTSVGILVEGYDDPPLSCLILARPTKSALLFEQMLGRITRLFEGKSDGLILDVVDVSRAHRLQTVANLFGLPAAMNLKGRLATKAADQVEAALSHHPQLQPELFASVDQLLAEAERITLDIRPVDLVPHLAPEVVSEARLAWIRLPSMEYALPLAGRAQVRVRENLLEQWEIVTLPERYVSSVHPNRREAFTAAEEHIAALDPKRWQLAHHQAAWRREPPSEAQQALLKTLGVAPPATRGEASQLIDQLRAQRQTGWLAQPATSKQRWFLKQHGAWQDNMSRGEAGAAINEIKRQEANDATRPPLREEEAHPVPSQASDQHQEIEETNTPSLTT